MSIYVLSILFVILVVFFGEKFLFMWLVVILVFELIGRLGFIFVVFVLFGLLLKFFLDLLFEDIGIVIGN